MQGTKGIVSLKKQSEQGHTKSSIIQIPLVELSFMGTKQVGWVLSRLVFIEVDIIPELLVVR